MRVIGSRRTLLRWRCLTKSRQPKTIEANSIPRSPRLRAHMKVGLRELPSKNRLRELKALFDLVLPGYMPQEADYNRNDRPAHRKGPRHGAEGVIDAHDAAFCV